MFTTHDSYGLGCKWGARDANLPGKQDSIIFLDFGNPVYRNGHYGVQLYNQDIISATALAHAVEIFAQGYWNCLGQDYESKLIIAVGTNSSGDEGGMFFEHGVTWAQMVNEVNNWLMHPDHLYFSQVAVVGASNIEPGFNPPAIAKAWVNGYDSASLYWFYNVGSTEGCPSDYPPEDPETGTYPPNPCNSGWTQDDIYYVSWGVMTAWPLPEIYNVVEENAKQWYRIGIYGARNYNTRMTFDGSLTQYQACLQNPGECDGTDNLPEEGYKQLFKWLHMDKYDRTIKTLKWSTDIMEYHGSPGEVP
jgi:hypothetical protein